MLNNTPNQPSKFRTRNWVEINDNARGTYNTISQIKFVTMMLKLTLCNAYILLKETTTVTNMGTAATSNIGNIKIIFKNCAPFTYCISKINNTQVDNAKDIDVVMSMYNLIE